MANFADSIEPVLDLGGAISFPMQYGAEEASQTAVEGTPVQINGTDGGVQAWDGTTVAAGIAGFAAMAFSNLGSLGSGQAQPFSPVLGPGSVIGNYAANPNQPLAVITPPMVPYSDGTIGFYTAAPTTIFIAKIGTSTSVTPVATALNQRGTLAGLTKDTGNNYWYVDTNKSNAVRIVGFSPLEAIGTVGGHVYFVILNSVAQLFQ
jgi:hypothetical protein